MSITETPTPTAPKPKRKPRRAKAPARAVVERQAVAKSEFDGMTMTDCCTGCTPDHCVISGINVCAHPRKGGLQSGQQSDHKLVARAARAKEHLKNLK